MSAAHVQFTTRWH